ncbi:MAG: SPOR domain-containing protein, partial [Alphaproteobacteria bacterium]|nr:SPOR domain-containing protein [Alphaproteobacteria bacterium]
IDIGEKRNAYITKYEIDIETAVVVREYRYHAEAAEKKIRSGHPSLFSGKQFVILAAVLPNGQTTYRLRIAFSTSNDANGFCRNAKSDGLDCYVAK